MSQVLKTQFFAYLLALLAGRSHLSLVIVLSLNVSLAIGRAELIDRKVAVSFFDYPLYNKLIGFFR